MFFSLGNLRRLVFAIATLPSRKTFQYKRMNELGNIPLKKKQLTQLMNQRIEMITLHVSRNLRSFSWRLDENQLSSSVCES